MAVNRLQGRRFFTKEYQPQWNCPFCSRGILNLLVESLSSKEDARSIQARADQPNDWEYEWEVGSFICFFVCNVCRANISANGKYSIEVGHEEDGDGGYYQTAWQNHQPLSFSEAPLLFRIPDKIPDAVKSELEKSFALYWQDNASCLNRVRVALECLMDTLKVQRRVNKNGKQTELTLHARIEKWRVTQPQLAEIAIAAKWLGNAGSHRTDVSDEDVLDAYEIFDYILNELYVSSSVKKLAQNINRRKGPLRRVTS